MNGRGFSVLIVLIAALAGGSIGALAGAAIAVFLLGDAGAR